MLKGKILCSAAKKATKIISEAQEQGHFKTEQEQTFEEQATLASPDRVLAYHKAGCSLPCSLKRCNLHIHAACLFLYFSIPCRVLHVSWEGHSCPALLNPQDSWVADKYYNCCWGKAERLKLGYWFHLMVSLCIPESFNCSFEQCHWIYQ